MSDDSESKPTPAPSPINRRRFVSGLALALGPTLTAGCGGGGGGEVAEARNTPAATPPAAPPPSSPRPVITTLQVSAGTASGSQPFAATLLPLQGQIPAGTVLVSDDDATLAHSVFNTWPDGSAAIVVVNGTTTVTAGETKTLRVQSDATATETRQPLTPADISRAVRSVKVEVTSTLTATRTDFTTPDRIWWANARAICARYRVRLPHRSLEAVVDVHVYAGGQAFVEVVLENGHMDTLAPSWPYAIAYSIASVSVNDQALIQNVSTAGAPEAQHVAFRAWYTSGWVGNSARTIRVTQLHTDLQKHPLLFKCVRTSTADLSTYSTDSYRPWATGRQRGRDMGSTGDHGGIGPIPQWEARFLQSGDPRAALATETSALAVLTFNVNYRDTRTGWVPNFTDIGSRDQQGDSPAWLRISNPEARATWEVAHHPAAGLMAFVARPSPVFMEIAQKIAVWNGTWSGANNDFAWTSGTHGHWYQMRGRAWCFRSLVHATFLTPRDMAWRTGGERAIYNNVVLYNRWRNDSKQRLNVMWDYLPATGLVGGSGSNGFFVSMWHLHFTIPELHKASRAGLLSGSQQTELTALADWAAMQTVRWVNEQPNGGWRWVTYQTNIGTNANTINSLPTWGEQMDWHYTDNPPSVAGPWHSIDGAPTFRYAGAGVDGRAGAYYPSYFWNSLVAAVERDLPGARDAWNTVNANVTGLSGWLDGFGTDPRWGSFPRNV
jgi:hypothetical protein